MKHRLEFEQWVPFPLERVLAFFCNPENLPRIMPAASSTRLIALNRMPPPRTPSGRTSEKAAGVGSTILTSLRVFPLLPLDAGGRRVSQNLNGTATSPTCRTKVHSRAGITGTSLRARGRAEPREQPFAT